MDRRTLLGTLVPVVLGGCIEAPRDDEEPLRLDEASLRDTGRCADAETASVDVSESRVRVTGCVTGPNGCAVASFGSATVSGRTLDVVVTTRRDAPPDTACTQALVPRGYEATIRLARGRPDRVRVIHDAAGGRRQVAETAVDS
ncbi:hypothetical protein [Haloplanus halophilus]|uniref:hypothetical protein n=1 Tax=Haloplanus halophilus TaxID=2949993 RepID=UPI00203BD71C|nr:hypothetical protein [Haloplanus sp. GDY1]